VVEDAEHVLTECPRFEPERRVAENSLGDDIEVSSLVEHMLSCSAKWSAVCSFANSVMTKLRTLEQARRQLP